MSLMISNAIKDNVIEEQEIPKETIWTSTDEILNEKSFFMVHEMHDSKQLAYCAGLL